MQATSAQVPTSVPDNTLDEHNFVGIPRGGSRGGTRGGNAGGRVARGAEYLLFGEGCVDGVEPTIQLVWMLPGTSTTTTTRGRKRGRPTNAEKGNMVHRRHGTVYVVGILNAGDTLNPTRRGSTPVFRALRVQVEAHAAIPQATHPDHQPTPLQNTNVINRVKVLKE